MVRLESMVCLSIVFIVILILMNTLHDRTNYGSSFARADNLWFRCRVRLVGFGPQKGVKSDPCGQIMLFVPDII